MHVHYLQEEAARVVRGKLGYQVLGGEPQFAGPGELVVWPAARRTSGGTRATTSCTCQAGAPT